MSPSSASTTARRTPSARPPSPPSTTPLTRAEDEAGALLLTGREGKLSAGFDLSVMTSGEEAMQGLVRSGAELLVRWYASPLPTVAACTGHALAMGSLLLLASDTRIGAEGPFKLGLNEVAIGMGLPIFAVELARDRLSPRAFTAATIQGQVYDPAGALEAGYLDRLVAADELEADRPRGGRAPGPAPPRRGEPHQGARPPGHRRPDPVDPRRGHGRHRHARPPLSKSPSPWWGGGTGWGHGSDCDTPDR